MAALCFNTRRFDPVRRRASGADATDVLGLLGPGLALKSSGDEANAYRDMIVERHLILIFCARLT